MLKCFLCEFEDNSFECAACRGEKVHEEEEPKE